MANDVFVMLLTENGSFTPLMEKDGEDICKFGTKDEAESAAEGTFLGHCIGYEVFELGYGI